MRLRHVVVAIVLAAPALAAQKTASVPKRPVLPMNADTNDAAVYYQYGLRMVDSKPDESITSPEVAAARGTFDKAQSILATR